MLLITGANGQLGKAVVEQCLRQGIPFYPVTKSELDITCASSVNRLVSEQKFDCIINCAAYTAVDAAETDVANAYTVNAFGPWVLASTGVRLFMSLRITCLTVQRFPLTKRMTSHDRYPSTA